MPDVFNEDTAAIKEEAASSVDIRAAALNIASTLGSVINSNVQELINNASAIERYLNIGE